MLTTIAPVKVNVSVIDLTESAALTRVSAWLLFRNGRKAGRVLWVLSTGPDGNCVWKCAVECADGRAFGITKSQRDDVRLTGQVVGKSHNSAGDDQVASFAACLLNNGLVNCELDYHNSRAAHEYLQGLGFQVFEAL